MSEPQKTKLLRRSGRSFVSGESGGAPTPRGDHRLRGPGPTTRHFIEKLQADSPAPSTVWVIAQLLIDRMLACSVLNA